MKKIKSLSLVMLALLTYIFLPVINDSKLHVGSSSVDSKDGEASNGG